MNRTGSGYSNHKDPVVAGMEAAKEAMKGLADSPPKLFFAFAAPSYDFHKLIEGVRKTIGDTPLLGCSTAGEFTQRSLGHDSIAVFAIGGDGLKVATGVGRNLRANQESAVQSAMSHFNQAYRTARQEGFQHATCFVLADGLAGNGERLVELVHEASNSLAQVVGGAAADAAKFEKTVTIVGDKAESDAVTIASVFTRTPIGLGVFHGLSAATKPKVVTKASGGVIYEIDGKPAFEAYREYAKSKGIELTDANREEFMIVNELGMATPVGHKIRAPLKANPDGSLLMAAEVPAGMAVCIMQGSADGLISGTQKAAESALAALKGAPPAGAIMFDCICRRIFLGDRYSKQVEAVGKATGNIPIAGWETYGEIALTQNQDSGWHNSTSVIAIIPA